MQRQATNGTLISSEDLSATIQGGLQSMVCPDHGQYRVNPLGTDPECTHPGHRLPNFHQFEEFQKRSKAQGRMAP